ncbi:hypothetical protein NM208_g12990 [Fusarium decemcellulare]|uniref:Uncharacterized protein n=1 Tax=Fusarium decemcellulare TaxID=57161 RepID=A0ACC1RMQ6_9HYPO|nr:hypothetical protein NM208_g12990 [Fusarium decemcellulare]
MSGRTEPTRAGKDEGSGEMHKTSRHGSSLGNQTLKGDPDGDLEALCSIRQGSITTDARGPESQMPGPWSGQASVLPSLGLEPGTRAKQPDSQPGELLYCILRSVSSLASLQSRGQVSVCALYSSLSSVRRWSWTTDGQHLVRRGRSRA